MSNFRKYGQFIIETVPQFHIYNGDLRVTSEHALAKGYQRGLESPEDFLNYYDTEYRKIGADASGLHIRVRDKVSALYLNDWHRDDEVPDYAVLKNEEEN